MDSSKAKKFNEKMGRPKYSKGGYIKKIADRKYFAVGGQAIAPGALGGPGNPTNTNGTGIGGISNALGLNAQSANIQAGTNAEQLSDAYTNANNAINTQVGLTNTLVPQATTGVNAQNQVLNQELGMTTGAGPNPALNQLASTTGTNVANEAALIAGQRGAGANPGLAARSVAMAGTNANETAAGEAATLEAQQQIAAQQNAAALAGNQIGQATGATTALNTAQQNEQNVLEGANSNYNNTAAGMQSNINNVNAQMNKGVIGGITSGLSSLTGGLFNKGGEVETVPPHHKHKLDFVHKMTKMALDHFDGGGTVDANGSLAKTASDFFGRVGGIPEAQGADKPPQQTLDQKNQQIREQNKNNMGYAAGGSVAGNPLVSAITNGGSAPMPQGPGYNALIQSTGPNIEQTQPLGGPSLSDQAASGFKSGQGWKNSKGINKANAGLEGAEDTFNNDLSAGPAEEIASGGLGSNAFAQGGTIWDMHPSAHQEFSANHFSNYFSKGGEAKEVKAMVSPGERYWNPEEVEMIKHGADPLKLGKIFPGKDKVPGKDSRKNDTVPTTLQEGGIVNPLHVEKSKDPNKSRLFVLKSLRATGKHMKKPMGMN